MILEINWQKKNACIDSEINIFIKLCLSLIVEFLKFELVKEVKCNQCEECGAKCVYILFTKEQKKIVEESKPTKNELEKGINIVENIFSQNKIFNLNTIADDSKNLAINVIYLNDTVNKDELKMIEKNVSGTVLYIENIIQLKVLLEEVNRKNKINKLNYKFLLICSGKLSDNLTEFLVEKQNKIYQDIINVLIYCENEQKYVNLKNNYDVVDNQNLLEEYIKNFKKNSKIYNTFPIINYTLYTEKDNEIHKEIAKYYGKVAYSYKNAINIFKEFLDEYEFELKIRTNDESKEGG